MSILKHPAVEGEAFYFRMLLKNFIISQLIGLGDLEISNEKNRKIIKKLKIETKDIWKLMDQLEVIVECGMKHAEINSAIKIPSRLAEHKNKFFREIEEDAKKQYLSAKETHVSKHGEKKGIFSKAKWAEKNLNNINKKHRSNIKLRTLRSYLNGV